MICTSNAKVLCLCVGGLLAGGCASTGLSPLHYAVRHVQGGDADAGFAAATASLVDLGYKIDTADALAGVITTRPMSTSPDLERIHTDSRLRESSRMRRVATVRIVRGGGAVNVYCRVVVQEQVTEAYRMFRSDYAISDVPDDTPIDRDAATTEAQNTVWKTIGRDKAAERRILEAILERTGGESG